MNFMIDNKYPLGYLPNGLTDKNLSEITRPFRAPSNFEF